MPDLIEPAVGQAIIAFLTSRRAQLGLGDAGISARREDGPHVRVAESGGAGDRDRVLFAQQITLETFGGTLTITGDLMRRTFAGIRSLQHTTFDGVEFGELRTFGAGMNAEDPTTRKVRYTRTFAIDVRLQLLA